MIFGNPVRGTIYLTPSASGRWNRTQRFGCTGVVYERPFGTCAHFHRGIDIAKGPQGCGADLLAAQAGTVHFAGTVSDGATVVEIDHGGGVFTLYAHLAKELVSVGQQVAKGQKIGTVGQTGNATGCHVHFAVKTGASGAQSIADDGNGRWVDPWPLLEQNQSTATVHPAGDGINIRASQGSGTTLGPKYAHTLAGRIVRVSDGADQGLTTTPRKWGGRVTGASYPAGQGYRAGNTWERIELAGAYRFIATPLAIVT